MADLYQSKRLRAGIGTKEMTNPRIPDEVMSDRKAEYKNTLETIGWDADCIFAALNGFDHGREDMAKRIVEWLRGMDFFIHERTGRCVATKCWADEIEVKFLSSTSTADKLVVRE